VKADRGSLPLLDDRGSLPLLDDRGSLPLLDDRGSLPLAMLVTLIGVMLSAVLTPVLIGEVQSTRNQVWRVHALDAAQTGLDIGLGQIRNANDGTGNGVRAKLPCGPFAGHVGVGGTARYQVTIDYLNADPRGHTDAWVTTNHLTCLAGNGTVSIPAYALLRADGTDQATGAFTAVPTRSVRATYTFQTVNQVVLGGLIHSYHPPLATDLCLDAGSANPAVGTNLTLQRCTTASAQQTFAYNSNLTLALTSSKSPTQPLGLCLDAGPVPHGAGNVVQIRQCGATTMPQQQWSLNDSSNFEGTANGSSLDGFCFNAQSPGSVGSFLVLGSAGNGTCHGGYDARQSFLPEATVGAGAAGATNSQLVNLSQFGRCLDVTEQNVAYPYLTAWPCTQAPDPANVTWSQKWVTPTIAAGNSSATGRITTNPGSLYCLESPGSTAAGQYPKLVGCPGGTTPQNLTWTIYSDTGTYATSYRIVDGYGYCLAPTDPTATPADLHPNGQQVSKLVVTTCGGSALQKWNAPPDAMAALPLRDIGEK
jgi:hypothetical protein